MLKLRIMKASITFSNSNIYPGERLSEQEKTELKEFIISALESWGGQRHPDDWLSDSLENVEVKLDRNI